MSKIIVPENLSTKFEDLMGAVLNTSAPVRSLALENAKALVEICHALGIEKRTKDKLVLECLKRDLNEG